MIDAEAFLLAVTGVVLAFLGGGMVLQRRSARIFRASGWLLFVVGCWAAGDACRQFGWLQ
jgi:hypothetical protein